MGSSPPHNVWVVERELNEEFICVRYVYGMRSVTRDVWYSHLGWPVYFGDEREAQARCDAMNVKIAAAIRART